VDGRWPAGDSAVRLDLNNAGTAVRFLSAASALGQSPITIDGNARMRQRPIAQLVSALRELGVHVDYDRREGCVPITVRAGDRLASELSLGRTSSGQFISALLMLGSALEQGLTLHLDEGITSASYVHMTLEMLSRVGASVRTSADLGVIRVGPAHWEHQTNARTFDAFDMQIEPDASGATYFWASAAIVKGARARVMGLGGAPLQADAGFADVLARMGASVHHAGEDEDAITCQGGQELRPVLADMHQMPDAAVTLAAVCAFAKGTSVIRGVRTLRVKECDRVAALRTELGKLGVVIEADTAGDADAMTIRPPDAGIDFSSGVDAIEFDTYADHRMAMALAIVGLRRPRVFIRDPACVGKTYPAFWHDFSRLTR